jgi:hypothetical protein
MKAGQHVSTVGLHQTDGIVKGTAKKSLVVVRKADGATIVGVQAPRPLFPP